MVHKTLVFVEKREMSAQSLDLLSKVTVILSEQMLSSKHVNISVFLKKGVKIKGLKEKKLRYFIGDF